MRANYVLGLREIADWYEAHPEAPLLDVGQEKLQLDSYTFRAKPEHIRAIGAGDKVWRDSTFHYVVSLPHATLRFVTSRENVCVQKVVGYREIPEQHIEAHVIPAKRTEIVEWECRESLLEEVSHAE